MKYERGSSIKRKITILTIIGFVIGVGVFLSLQFVDYTIISKYLERSVPINIYGASILILILTLAMSIGLPRQIAAFSSGYLFGIYYGTLIATLAAISGCLITLLFSRYLLGKTIEKIYPKQTLAISHFFAEQTFTKALIIRLLPVGSNFITNVLAGVTQVSIKPYLLGTGIGFIPQMIVFTLLGSGIQLEDKQLILVSSALCFIAFLLGGWLYRNSLIAKKRQQQQCSGLF